MTQPIFDDVNRLMERLSGERGRGRMGVIFRADRLRVYWVGLCLILFAMGAMSDI
jgi:hypothetical protein